MAEQPRKLKLKSVIEVARVSGDFSKQPQCRPNYVPGYFCTNDRIRDDVEAAFMARYKS